MESRSRPWRRHGIVVLVDVVEVVVLSARTRDRAAAIRPYVVLSLERGIRIQMRTLIPIALAGVLLGCVHQPVAGSSLPRKQPPPEMSALGQPVSAAVRAQKQECEKLLNAALPFAEKMLSKHRELRPFAIALTRDERIISTSRYATDNRPPSRNALAVLEKGLQQGAESGRYKASALVLDVLVVPPGRTDRQHAISIRLDHRDGYSVIVFVPYVLDADSLAIEKPFSEWGEQRIFSR